jgi:hypothetical protein
MGNISNVVGNLTMAKAAYTKLLGYGEGATSDDFEMTISEYPDLAFLCQTTQLPAMAREMIESYGPHRVKFMQAGPYINAQDVPVSFKEVISGKAYEAIRDWVKNKRYLTVELRLKSESNEGGAPSTTVVMEDCWLELEGVDLSVEDATIVKPTGTLHANWVGWDA